MLLDELEKAHPDVSGILLQIMEEGTLTDSSGRRVSFRNALVVMTSNLGSDLRSDGLGFQPAGREDKTMEALRKHFTPEFLGRIDAIVPFAPLPQEAMTGIAQKYLQQLQERAAVNGIQLFFPDELAQILGKKSTKQGGARNIRHLVQEQVEGPLAVYLLKCGRKPNKIKMKLEDGNLSFLG